MAKHNDPRIAQNAEAEERRVKVFELTKAGASLRQIAQQLSVSHETVRKDRDAVLKELQKVQIVEAEQYRVLELERLDMAMIAIAPQVKKGSFQAIDRWIRLSERRSKLLGLDAPTKIDHRFDKDPEQLPDAELDTFISELQALVR